jgi:hypothetical protein
MDFLMVPKRASCELSYARDEQEHLLTGRATETEARPSTLKASEDEARHEGLRR